MIALCQWQAGRHAVRQAVESRMLPALRAFNPDLIMISAGFDAGNGDLGCARFDGGYKVLYCTVLYLLVCMLWFLCTPHRPRMVHGTEWLQLDA